jgi:hypothetical protein
VQSISRVVKGFSDPQADLPGHGIFLAYCYCSASHRMAWQRSTLIESFGILSTRAELSTNARIVIAILVGVPLLGMLLTMYWYDRALLFLPPAYTNLRPPVSGLLFIVILVAFSMGSWLDEALAPKYPTRWFRWLVLKPLGAVMCTGIIVSAPLGYICMAALLFGSDTEQVARVVRIQENQARKGCDQRATLSMMSVEKEICIAGLYSGASPVAAQEVTVSGRRTSLAFVVQGIK